MEKNLISQPWQIELLEIGERPPRALFAAEIVDHGAEHLDVEVAAVAGYEQGCQDPGQRDDPVPERDPMGRAESALGEVADLHEADAVDPAGEVVVQMPFYPAVI